MVRPSVPDPPLIDAELWGVFGAYTLGFDVGANCGQSIPHMMDHCDKVIAFEPHPASFGYMHDFWGNDHPLVRVSRFAVSDHDGDALLAQLDGEQIETGQLVQPHLHGMEWEPTDWSDARFKNYTCRSLESLSSVFGMPGLIKVDTEGHETYVLSGADLLDGKPDWLVEFHSPDNMVFCKSWLETRGYEVTIVRHPDYPEGSQMWHQHGWLQALAP